jgi:hypothetical protein
VLLAITTTILNFNKDNNKTKYGMQKLEDLSESSVPFPFKLYTLLSREDGPIVQWVQHGYAFRIIKQDAFVREIVPRYFKRKHCPCTSYIQLAIKLFPCNAYLKTQK